MKSSAAIVAIALLLLAGACGAADSSQRAVSQTASASQTPATDAAINPSATSPAQTPAASEPVTPESLASTTERATTTERPTTTTQRPTVATEAEPQPRISNLPDVELLSVASGQRVNLNSVEDGLRYTLLWFWAPH